MQIKYYTLQSDYAKLQNENQELKLKYQPKMQTVEKIADVYLKNMQMAQQKKYEMENQMLNPLSIEFKHTETPEFKSQAQEI